MNETLLEFILEQPKEIRDVPIIELVNTFKCYENMKPTNDSIVADIVDIICNYLKSIPDDIIDALDDAATYKKNPSAYHKRRLSKIRNNEINRINYLAIVAEKEARIKKEKSDDKLKRTRTSTRRVFPQCLALTKNKKM